MAAIRSYPPLEIVASLEVVDGLIYLDTSLLLALVRFAGANITFLCRWCRVVVNEALIFGVITPGIW